MTIHRGLVLAAPVAEEMIELLERFFVVAAVALEGDGEVFAGMRVVQGEGAGLVQRRRIMNRACACEQQQRPQAEPVSGLWQNKQIELARETNQHVYSPPDRRAFTVFLLQTPAKEGERFLKAGRLTEVYRPAPKYA